MDILQCMFCRINYGFIVCLENMYIHAYVHIYIHNYQTILLHVNSIDIASTAEGDFPPGNNDTN
jgi:hypothetical protein